MDELREIDTVEGMFFLCGAFVNEDAEVAHRYATLGLVEVRYSSVYFLVVINIALVVPFCVQAWQGWAWPHCERLPGDGEDLRLVSGFCLVFPHILIFPQQPASSRPGRRWPRCADR